MDFVQTAQLSFEKETTVKFTENLELTCSPTCDGKWFNITNVKGDFEITEIFVIYDDGSKSGNRNDKTNKRFGSYYGSRFSLLKKYGSWYSTCNAAFYITANVEMKEMCVVTYQLQIPSARLQYLEPYHFFKEEFVLPGYDELKFTYCIKKIKNSGTNDIEVHIVNPYDVKIQGKEGDYKVVQRSADKIDLLLSFGFYPSILDKSLPSSANESNPETCTSNQSDETVEPEPSSSESSEQIQHVVDVSRPESVISTQTNAVKILHKISSNPLYYDVFFVASDDIKIFAHRCILAEFSNIFEKIFEASNEIPVNINVEDFDADIIHSALNFIYQIGDAINGKETDVFIFAVKYGIQELVDACRLFFEESVNPINVCQYIQIAYSNNFANLKQKCLKLLIEKRKEIDSTKIADLPKNILVDAFTF